MSPTFGALGVPDDLAARLHAAGIVEPFPIQAAVIPDALAGRDVTGRAPTGSGKTLAFGIPLVARLTPAQRRRPTALVLAPTRELAEQIATELRPLARLRRHEVVSVYGGVGYGPQRKALDAGAELVVACPGRLEDLLTMRALTLQDVDQVVIDEADRMADMGFLPAVRRILEQTQVRAPGAAVLGHARRRPWRTLAKAVQRQPVRHEVGPAGPDMTAVHHAFWAVDRTERPDVVGRRRATRSARRWCSAAPATAPTASPASSSSSASGRRRSTAAAASRSATRPSRRSRPAPCRPSSPPTSPPAACTSTTSQAVVHFDPPEDGSTYIHRSGRTARAGASGVVVSFVERGAGKDLAKTMKGHPASTPKIVRPDVRAPASAATPTVQSDAPSTPPVAGRAARPETPGR